MSRPPRVRLADLIGVPPEQRWARWAHLGGWRHVVPHPEDTPPLEAITAATRAMRATNLRRHEMIRAAIELGYDRNDIARAAELTPDAAILGGYATETVPQRPTLDEVKRRDEQLRELRERIEQGEL